VNRETTTKNGECLKDDVLAAFLEGSLEPVVRSACEVHLIACDACREKLALFMKVLREEIAPAEVASLEEVSRRWDERNIRPVPVPRRPESPLRRFAYPLAGVAAAAVVAVLFIGVPFGGKPPASVITDQLLATRPFVPRVSGQTYREAPEVTRGPRASANFEDLTSEMTDRAADAYEMGQFFLLNKDYPKAIKWLREAISESRGAPADVHNDLGVAYLQSGVDSLDAAEAEFKEALARNANHTPAVFNLSILYDEQGRSAEAETERLKYLKMDPDSGWAKEIERKLSPSGTR